MGEAAGQNSTTLLLGSRKKYAETYIKAAKTKRNSLSFEEAEVLRERADAFLENAKHLIHTGSYDLELQIKTLLDREDNMLLVSLK